MNEGDWANFVDFALKLVAMATSLERSEKEAQISDLGPNTYHMHGKNVMKISPVDPEIICLTEFILRNIKK